jgi:hypothetical protein
MPSIAGLAIKSMSPMMKKAMNTKLTNIKEGTKDFFKQSPS